MEKQQVGLKMPTYLLNNIDGIITEYKVNRSKILIKEQDVYEHLHETLQEVKLIKEGKIPTTMK